MSSLDTPRRTDTPAAQVEKPKGSARHEILSATGGALDRLRANAELAKVRTEYLNAHPELFQNIDRIILRYQSTDVSPTHSRQYELAFAGMRDALTTTASVMLSQALERHTQLTPVAEAEIDQVVTGIHQWLDRELTNIATTRVSRLGATKVRPTIDLADLEYFGNGVSPAIQLLHTLQNSPRNAPLVKAELAKYLRMRLRTGGERASTFGSIDDERKERYIEDFKREVAGMVTLFAGHGEPVINQDDLKKIFDDLAIEQQTAATSQTDDQRRLAAEAAEAITDLFEETGREDADGRPIIKAQADLKKLQAGVDRYLTQHDTSGTMLGKNGSLYQVFYYYLLSNALALGAAGELIMHGTFPGETLAALGIATAVAMPDKADALIAPIPERQRVITADTAAEQAERYPESVQKWARALDASFFAPKTQLAKALDDLRSRGSLESTAQITKFLKLKNAEKADELGGPKKFGGDYEPRTFVDARMVDTMMQEHALQHLTSPTELRQLFSLLDHACQHQGLPASIRDA